MIRLPRNFFANLSTAQYREQLKLLPKLTDEKAQLYTMLGFTLIAMSIFGIFAINPTLSTIAELQRQHEDLLSVRNQLAEKAQNLSILQDKYNALSNDLPFVFEAMPQKPEVAQFVAKVNALLSQTNLKVNAMDAIGVDITPDNTMPEDIAGSFVFSVEAEGTYEDILSFTQDLTQIDRLVFIETVTIDKDDRRDVLVLNVRGRQYFKP